MRTPVLVALIATSLASPGLADTVPLPSGSYLVVAVRAASDAAASIEAREQGTTARLGAILDLDVVPVWHDGTACDGWHAMADATSGPTVADPYLSDLQIVPGPGDRRLNFGLVIDCGGAAYSSLHHLLMVDERVLVERTPNGAAYVILEKPLAPAEGLALERGLAAAGHDPGPVDGTVDAATRAAIAAYASDNGAAYRFEAGIITANVLVALTGG